MYRHSVHAYTLFFPCALTLTGLMMRLVACSLCGTVRRHASNHYVAPTLLRIRHMAPLNGGIRSNRSRAVASCVTDTSFPCEPQSQRIVISPRDGTKGGYSSHASVVTSYNHSNKQKREVSLTPSELGFSQCNVNYSWETVVAHPLEVRLASRRNESLLQRLHLFGMPAGYPDSCGEGFRRYFLLSLCSSFVSSFASSIGYQSILNGFLLASSPQLWMLKDLAPALAAAYLANRVISYENRPKFWFVFSVALHNLSVIAEMIIPTTVPNHLLAAAILTSCVRQSASLMFLVTRASALQHFAISNNLAELTKKFNSFGMVIYTVSTALGIAYTSLVPSVTAQLATVLMCCGANLAISHLSMCNIAFRILNETTLSVILRFYMREEGHQRGRVLSPREVSDAIGLRMIDRGRSDGNDRIGLLYVNPPIGKIRIRYSSLDEDVVYLCSSEMFLFALWEPSAPLSLLDRWHRWEKPQLTQRISKWFCSKKKNVPTSEVLGKRLVLFVHQECDSLHLLTAYLLAYTALLQHADDLAELRRFLRSCNGEQSLWLKRGRELRKSLQAVGWDVEQLSLDPLNFRLSSLSFAAQPRCMRHLNPLN
ncbi:hypothetical protein, conserved [Trypanosoma brucei gambiense DAL972]|uniref:Protein root UVB sensitive/RUS domain-containing protein n=1 Tax=Trypanosoma brucei gambiense (strain MHOM/CI/86/DAL972) TaxID=679716 RepID=D0AA76_TRYB9|nr:hypothetical protein, conserved [Trypanosoma brucei gambiense DAL972]CBH18577.1 hypothetical protein, conserved [Trypanosoma brucei gambiense DAL972]|eukprot:XP_011780841.1 hypothetical protein, conserved [Trypanosoma brucei gambiense DAL972]